MKIATLVCRMSDGTLKAVADNTIGDLLLKARAARNSGLFDGKPVDAGMVMCSWRPGAVIKFRVETESLMKPAKKK